MKNFKSILIAVGVCILVALIILAVKHRKSTGNGVSQTANTSTSAQLVDTGAEVTNLQTAENNPQAVFRLNLSQQPVTTSVQIPAIGTGTATSVIVVATSVPATDLTLPAGFFSELTNIIQLNLNGKNLSSLPPEIGTLQSLEVLYAGNNQLTTLPQEIGNLKKLTMLSLFDNKITSLPSAMSKLTNLKFLGLTGNPIVKSSTAMAALKAELPVGVQIMTK